VESVACQVEVPADHPMAALLKAGKESLLSGVSVPAVLPVELLTLQVEALTVEMEVWTLEVEVWTYHPTMDGLQQTSEESVAVSLEVEVYTGR